MRCSFYLSCFLGSLITSRSFTVLVFCIALSLIALLFFFSSASNNFHLHQVTSQNQIVGYFARVYSVAQCNCYLVFKDGPRHL